MRSDWTEWVLLDREGKLVTYGEEVYRGVSARKALDSPTHRALLLPQLLAALKEDLGPSAKRQHTHNGEEWVSYVRTLRAPHSGVIVGALGTLRPQSVEEPTPPVVGCWEWVIPAGGSGAEVSTFWDRGLYELYDVEPDTAADDRGAFSTPEWFFKVISPRDSPRLHAMISKGISIVTPELHSIIYRVTAGYGTGHEYEQYLRLVGRATGTPGGEVRLSGVSHEVVGRVEEWTPGLDDEIASTDILAAVIRLTTSALCLLDPATGQLIVAAENGWSRAGISPPSSAALDGLVAEDELPGLLSHLRSVATEDDSRVETYVTRLYGIDGSLQPFAVRATPVKTQEADANYTMVEFVALRN